MKLSYKLRIYPNRGKLEVIKALCALWRTLVNYYIDLYWKLPEWEFSNSKPPKEFRGSGTKLENLASVKAWQIVRAMINKHKKSKENKKKDFRLEKDKGISKQENEIKVLTKPEFKKEEVELDETLFTFGDWTTKEFDVWIKCYSGQRGKRVVIPAKKHRRVNYWLNRGAVLSNSIKFKKIGKNWYVIIYLNYLPLKRQEKVLIGIDIDYKNGAVDSTGKIWFFEEWEDLRKRTKWRSYTKGENPLKQELNKLAKKLVNYYYCNFALEDLFIQDKNGRNKKFRRNYKNLPYKHLLKRLETLTVLEGFQAVRVNPVYTSQTCPVCEFRSKKNRRGDLFQCKRCGFTEHADVVGAVNVAIKAGLRYGLHPVVARGVAEGWRRLGTQPPVECLVACTPPQSRLGADFRTHNPPCQTCLFS